MVSQLCGQCSGETVLLLFLPLSNEPWWWLHASFKIDLLQRALFPLLDVGLFPVYFAALAPFCHVSAAPKKTCEIILCHYWSNIYTTLSKLHLAANMFRHLSTPHGAAGGLASIKHAIARTAGQNEERGCWWELCFSLWIFHNGPTFPQQHHVNVQISTGCRSLEKMKMHSDFTLTHVELCNKTFTPGK